MSELTELKAKCHEELDIYIKSTLRVENDTRHYMKQKRKAYHRLAQELGQTHLPATLEICTPSQSFKELLKPYKDGMRQRSKRNLKQV